MLTREGLLFGAVSVARFLGGYIKLWRKLDADELFDDVATSAVWKRLLIWAYRKPGRKRLGKGQWVTLERGQCATSGVELGARLKYCGKPIGRNIAERCLRELVEAGAISIERSSGGTIVTIVNFDRYQRRAEKTQQREQQHASNVPATTQQRPSNDTAQSGEERQEEQEEQEDAFGRARARVDRSSPTWEEAENQGSLILAKLAAIRDENAAGKRFSPEQLRQRLGDAAWAAIHVGGSFERFWHEYWSEREPTEGFAGSSAKIRAITDSKFRKRLATTLREPDFDPAEVIARLGAHEKLESGGDAAPH